MKIPKTNRRLSITIPETRHRQLENLAGELNVDMSFLVDIAVKRYLNKVILGKNKETALEERGK